MLLKNGFLINPHTNTQKTADIRISEGMISEIGQNLSPYDKEEILDLLRAYGCPWTY